MGRLLLWVVGGPTEMIEACLSTRMEEVPWTASLKVPVSVTRKESEEKDWILVVGKCREPLLWIG